MKSKTRSEIAIIVSSLCLFANFLIFLLNFFRNSVYSVSIESAIAMIILAISPSLPFCPVYISIWIDKLIKLKDIK